MYFPQPAPPDNFCTQLTGQRPGFYKDKGAAFNGLFLPSLAELRYTCPIYILQISALKIQNRLITCY